jgi:hypothetical protein
VRRDHRARRGVPGRSLSAAGRKNPGAVFSSSMAVAQADETRASPTLLQEMMKVYALLDVQSGVTSPIAIRSAPLELQNKGPCGTRQRWRSLTRRQPAPSQPGYSKMGRRRLPSRRARLPSGAARVLSRSGAKRRTVVCQDRHPCARLRSWRGAGWPPVAGHTPPSGLYRADLSRGGGQWSHAFRSKSRR